MSAGPGTTNPPAATPVENLGQRLREARLASGLSLRELARQLRVSASFVSQLENGKSQPSVATLYSLAQLLDVSIDVLFEPEPEDRRPVAGDAGSTAGALGTDGGTPSGPAGEATGGQVRPGMFDEAAVAPGSVAEALARTRAREATSDQPDPRSPSPGGEGRGPGGPSARFTITAATDRPRLVMDSGVIWEQLARNTDHHLDFMEITYPPGSSSTNDERMLRHQGFEYGYLLEGELQVTFGFDVFVLRAGESLGLDSSVPHLFTNTGDVAARGVWFVHHSHD